MRIATFNMQNLRLRSRGGQPVLDGALDQDKPGTARPIALDIADREKTAQVIAAARADVIALQEVFDPATLDHFHDHFLQPAGAPAYPHRYCFPGNDGRGLNVAALSRVKPNAARSHAALTGHDLGLDDLPPALRDNRLFRRDCLELEFATVTLFICHFKAPYPDAAKAHIVRKAEARGVRKLIEARFPDPATARWIILGDFNEPALNEAPLTSALAPLTDGFATDLLERLPQGTNWTYKVPGRDVLSRPDRLLVSPRLAREYPDLHPQILRSGMDGTDALSHASDHALVHADFTGL